MDFEITTKPLNVGWQNYTDCPEFGDFSLQYFLSRYIAGGGAIRESRVVSRRRLCLVTSGAPVFDAEAVKLAELISQYNSARQILLATEPHTVEMLCHINYVFTGGRKAGGALREVQNWVGKSLKKASYVPPPPEDVGVLMQDLIEYMNRKPLDRRDHAIASYVQLINIHPFTDANGRTARVICDALSSVDAQTLINPEIYRLNCKQDEYYNALRSYGIKSHEEYDHPFWEKEKDWSLNFKQSAMEELNLTKSLIMGKLGLCMLRRHEQELLNYLWCQPVITLKGIQDKFNWSRNESVQSITKLMQFHLLEKQSLRSVDNTDVFVCNPIFKCWTKIESLIFATDE